jgi:cell division septum initiation protein DivIVA
MSGQETPRAGSGSTVSSHAEQIQHSIANVRQGSGSAYRELAGRLGDVIQGVGKHAERILSEAEAESERMLREARAGAARISRDAREEADRVLSGLGDRRDAMIRHLQLLDDQLMRLTAEVEGMMNALAPEGNDQVASSYTEAPSEETHSPVVIPEPEPAEDTAATASPEVREPGRPEGNEANKESSLYDALWGPYEGVTLRPEDSGKR